MSDLIKAILSGGVKGKLKGLATEFSDRFQWINPLPFPGMSEPLSTTKPVVVVLVEARLLDELPTATLSTADLEARLRRFQADLVSDGYDARTFSVRMLRGSSHQDGQGVLALRTMFQQLYAAHPNFAGAILVGSFPEAMLVRRWIWKKTNESPVLAGVQHNNVDLLHIVPEVIAERSDIVLADLDGSWDQIYEPGPVQLESIRAIPDSSMGTWPVNGGLFTSSSFERGTVTFEDFFWIRDDDFDEVPSPSNANLILRLRLKGRNPECAKSDQTRQNPIAQPDISVSRINARNIGVMPDPTIIDANGKGFLDASGTPQAVQLDSLVLDGYHFWQQDAAFERQLLVDYFDRNHRFRSGGDYLAPFRTAAIATSSFNSAWNSAVGVAAALDKASTSFAAPVVSQDATLLDFVRWVKQPATIRGFATHAGHQGTQFDQGAYPVADLEAEIGGPPWRWLPTEFGSTITYSPSIDWKGDSADFYVYRSLWENKALASTGPSFFLHNGCHVNSPFGARTNAHESTNYAPRQEAESLLFYLNGLAIVGRAKEYNDFISPHFPKGFGAAGARFGDGLKEYFLVDGEDANLAKFENAVNSKRTYTWSILGDWTLQLRYGAIPIARFKKPHAVVWPLPPNRWLVTDGFETIKILSDREQAERVAAVIKHYRLTERYVVGDDANGWEYYLSDGTPPRAEVSRELREEGVQFEAGELTVAAIRGGWSVTAGQETIARFANRLDADIVVAVLQQHQATAVHWIGDRARAAMTYFTTRARRTPGR